MANETVEGTTTEVVVDEAARAAAAAAVTAAGADDKSGTNATTTDETSEGGEAAAVDEVVVTIGDEAPPQDETEQAPAWVKELRKTNREQARRIRELERTQSERTDTAKAVEVGPKPTMADKDIDYDSAKFEDALNKWNDRKRAADAATAKRQADDKKATDAWQERLNGYNEAKTQLKVKDFAEVETTVFETLAQVQQGIVVQGAENAALVIYALGKSPGKLKELAAITDPVKFAFAIAKLEKDLKVTTRKAPPPEKVVTGSGSKAGITDSTLERLRAEAEKTGDYTKVTAHKRKLRAA